MKKLLLLTFLFVSFLCEAQPKTAVIDWQKTIGGSDDDVLKCIHQTNEGGYILGGYSRSIISGEKTDSSRGSTDYWVVKLNVDKTIAWQKTIGGSSPDYLEIIEQTTDDGFVLGGYSYSGLSGEKMENSRGQEDYWVVKLSTNGSIDWQKTIGGSGRDGLTSMQQTSDGGYILGGYSNSRSSGEKTENSRGGYDYWVIKINAAANIIWQKTIGGENDDNLQVIRQSQDGGYIIGGFSNSNISGEKTDGSRGGTDYWIVKLNSTGSIVWQKTIGGTGSDELFDLIPTIDGGYILGGRSASNISGEKTENARGYYDYWIVKLNGNGTTAWQKTIGGSQDDVLKSIQQTIDGGYILGGYSLSDISGDKTENNRRNRPGDYGDYWVVKLNINGSVEWQKTIGGSEYDNLECIQQTSDGNYILGGWSGSNISGEKTENTRGLYFDYWVVKLKEIDADVIKGNIFQSKNGNCTQEPNERGAPNIILKTEPKEFYSVSDSTGNYTILTDTGKYTVKQIIPNYALPLFRNVVCPSGGIHQNISFTHYGQDTSEINFANDITLCAFLQVELSQDRMRRCFDNNATLKYCNIGNVDTTNVQVIVTLPEYVTFVSASNPNYTVNGKKITFNIGNLRANACGIINLVTHVDCIEGIVGLTQCIKAQILPRNECVRKIQPDYTLWDKGEISVDGRCTGNTARFVIKNIGQNMSDSSSYRIYKDAVQAVSRKFKLITGDSLVINVSALGNTYRLEADQTPHYPSSSQPSITIENCGTGVASRGFVNQQAQDFAAPDVEKICLPIRDSYDPNDKQVSPSGVGANKLVPHKIPLDFLIRFQNTGTDTAYKVVITDTLNQNLDLATLEFGASSHPYKIEFTGSGKPILKFTFDKINLVDSFTNEPKSHGFISFKITPYDSIPNGTIVKNSADIYFDFNLPIKTNTTQVSIDDRLPTGATLNLVTSVKQNNTIYEAIHVYPNPFTQTTNFEFVYNTKANQLFIYDVNGELVVQENIAGKTTFQLQRTNLSNGMYFYNIQNKDGEIIGRGKLVLQ
jgi:hypothetical protein